MDNQYPLSVDNLESSVISNSSASPDVFNMKYYCASIGGVHTPQSFHPFRSFVVDEVGAEAPVVPFVTSGCILGQSYPN